MYEWAAEYDRLKICHFCPKCISKVSDTCTVADTDLLANNRRYLLSDETGAGTGLPVLFSVIADMHGYLSEAR